MPLSSEPLRRLGFLAIGLFDGDDPRRGHESTLEIIELGERPGFDRAWVRHRPALGRRATSRQETRDGNPAM